MERMQTLLSGAAMLALLVGQPVAGNAGHISVQIDSDDSCRVRGSANGVPYEFIIDTGSSEVWLPLKDAAKLGYSLQQLHKLGQFSSRPRDGQIAAVELRELRIGDFVLHDVRASLGEWSGAPLIGVWVIKEMKHFQIDGSTCSLSW